ncbi:MAG: hypothetical protein AAGC55_33030, partial [Myxococcota bacterium]
MSVSIAVALTVCLAHGGSDVRAAPAQTLDQARQDFQLGKYQEAVPILNLLLYPKEQLSRRADLVEAHLLLGLAYLELSDR